MRLTLLSKLFVSTVLAGSAGLIAYHHFADASGSLSATSAAKTTTTGADAPLHRIVVGVNDFGGAYPGVVANDGTKAGPLSKFAAAGLDVEFRLVSGSKERLAAFDAGELDVMLLSVDYLANLAPGYAESGKPVKAFLMADWSRGNMGVVAKPEFRSVESLKNAKVATTRNTPTHYFLLDLLHDSNLSSGDIDSTKGGFLYATKTPEAASMFERGEVDAAALWEPYLSRAVASGKGHVLVSTATATNLVADVLFAKADFLAAHEGDIAKFTRAWFQGAAALEKDPDGSRSAIAKAFSQTDDATRGILAKIKPARFADNRSFFGLSREDAPFFTLYDDASRVWQGEGVVKRPLPAAVVRWTKGLTAIAPEFAAEVTSEDFHFTRSPAASAPALLTKTVSVYFASGSDKLDPNGKRMVDGLAVTLAEFGNTYVRVEGNTDNQGARDGNITLSKRRADALVEYLVSKYGFDRKRFVAVGYGPDKPAADNATEAGRELNRRTEFKLLANE